MRELGKGAMGIVFLARDPLIGRLVALKTVRNPTPGEDDSDLRDFHERFLREAQAAGTLSHPNIVTIHDVGQDEARGITFLAMEYIEGRNLKSCLAEREPLAISDIVDITGQVADALDYAHRKGIVHRDIKPANIIITTEGRVKIADFGIAKIASSTVTTTGRFLGTPKYMSPEQVRGSSVDGRSDLFSLGMVLYEMLTGKLPFIGDNMTTISYKIAHEEVIPPSAVIPGLAPELDRIVLRALAKEPWNRYQRGPELAADLREISLPADALPLRRLSRPPEDAAAQDMGRTLPSSPRITPGSDGGSEEDHCTVAQPAVPSEILRRPLSGRIPAPAVVTASPAAVEQPSRRFRVKRGFLLAAGAIVVGVLGFLLFVPSASNDFRGFPVLRARRHAKSTDVPALPAFLQESEDTGAAPLEEIPPATAPGTATTGGAATGAVLRVVFSSSLPGGNLRIEANRRLVLNKSFSSAVEGLDRSLALPPGDVRLKISLTAADGSFRRSRAVEGQFAGGRTRTLRVSVFKDQLLAVLEE